ncbi:hypothetical protein [Pectobacterium brasiliense]|uniref:hypothetical protein n=1 Tax=Pectobacterium brasiliense TaxID=180957 RepID=UPI001968F200|nr:hypothetical protein [Pectobacterium brasiliense]
MAYVECGKCGFKEEANKTFFLKALGGSFVGGGFWAWVTYFFCWDWIRLCYLCCNSYWWRGSISIL